MSIRDISNYTGKTYGYVRYHLNKSQIILNRTKMWGSYSSKIRNRDQNVLNEYKSGTTAIELSEKYNLAKSTIWAALRRAK